MPCQTAQRRLSNIIPGEDMARPRKPEGETALRATFSYRPDQDEKVKALRRQKKLSAVCQDAIDAAEV